MHAITVLPSTDAHTLTRFGNGDFERGREYVAMMAAFLGGRPENTRRNYRCALQQFFGLYNWISPQEVRPVHAAGFKVWLKERKKVSDGTAYNRMSAISSFFDYLCTPPSPTEAALLQYNPFTHIPRNDIQPTPYGRSTAMDWKTFHRIVESIPSDAMGFRDKAILIFFAFTGRRRQEVAHLRVRDVHMDEPEPWYEVRVKGGKLKKFQLPKLCIDAIKTYWKMADREGSLAPDQGVFCPMFDDHLNEHLPEFRPLANRTMNEILARAARRAGVDPSDPSICIHAIRHMAARDLDKAGARLQDIQRFLGHDNPATTQIYLGQLAGPAPALTDHLVSIRDGAKHFAEMFTREHAREQGTES